MNAIIYPNSLVGSVLCVLQLFSGTERVWASHPACLQPMGVEKPTITAPTSQIPVEIPSPNQSVIETTVHRFDFAGQIQINSKDKEANKANKNTNTKVNFNLQGNPTEGSLELSTFFGITVAQLEWAGDGATLTSTVPLSSNNTNSQTAPSVDELMQVLLGNRFNLPIAALFDWLNGIPTSVVGWDIEVLPNRSNPKAGNRLVVKHASTDSTVKLTVILSSD